MEPHKVFGIGFPKTGTSSLGKALKVLGYRLQKGININRPGRPYIEPPITPLKLLQTASPYTYEHSAFEDFPWMALYREMDRDWPGSKFILTVRDADSWLRSVKSHAPEITSTSWRVLAGSENAESVTHDQFLTAYHAHNEAVKEYFRERRDDLLILDLDTADWEQLCDFLGRRKPILRRYPHVNKSSTRHLRRIKRQLYNTIMFK